MRYFEAGRVFFISIQVDIFLDFFEPVELL